MTTVYELRGFMMRQTISAVMMVAVFIYGWWEILHAGGDTTGLVFGVLFIGGALYGGNQVLADSRDQVARLEAGANGETVVTLWRPTGPLRLRTDQPLDQWRMYVKIAGRGLRRPFLYLRHPGHPRELQLELRGDVTITDELRAMAGEALAEFEAQMAAPADDKKSA